jgi:hypothetical protein
MPNPRKRFEISDRLAAEHIGLLRLHAACRRPRRARLRTVRPRQAMSSIG